MWLRAAQTERGNVRGDATKKHEISRTLLSINIHFSVDIYLTFAGALFCSQPEREGPLMKIAGDCPVVKPMSCSLPAGKCHEKAYQIRAKKRAQKYS